MSDLLLEAHSAGEDDDSPLQLISATLLAQYRALAARCATCPACKMNDSGQETSDNAVSDPAS